jgi:hypothetical protein
MAYILQNSSKHLSGTGADCYAEESLPIKDYDSLSLSQITKRLSGLSTGEIERLRNYEAENKARRLLTERFEKRIRIIRQASTTGTARENPEKPSES